jgi:hypothetical protein
MVAGHAQRAQPEHGGGTEGRDDEQEDGRPEHRPGHDQQDNPAHHDGGHDLPPSAVPRRERHPACAAYRSTLLAHRPPSSLWIRYVYRARNLSRPHADCLITDVEDAHRTRARQ